VLIGLAVGVAFVSAREPARTPVPSRSVKPIVEDEAATELMEVSDSEAWNELPEPSVAADLTQAVRDGDIDVAPALVGPAADGTLSVLVHFDPRTDHINRPGVRAFAANQGGHVKYEYDILPNVINIRGLPQGAIAALARLPGVLKVEEDQELHTMIMDSIPLIRGLQTQITAAGLSATGAGVRICIIDTGIDSNALMYSTRIDAAAGWDFVNNDSNPEDDHGHGSHCAGTALGGANLSTGSCLGTQNAQGVAPLATLIGVKVLDATGNGSFSNVIAGINRCASAALPGGQADVISMSLGGGLFVGACDMDTAAQAANNAVTAGVVVVAAAGNNGAANGTGTPACGSKVIAVAATYDKSYPNCDFPSQTSFNWGICIDNSPVVDQLACFSNRSTKIDVAAPGCIIFSDDSTVAAGNGLIGFCGTSQATPHVAGLAALILSENPSLTPAQVQGYIRSGAIDKGAAGFDTSYGYGRIDVINSLNLAKPITNCIFNADCDDSNACTTDVCNAGTCTHTNITCNDSNACTTNSCNPATGCIFTAITCNDNNACTTNSCNPSSGCVFTAITCNDSNACTTDACAPATGCVFTPINCNDSNACTTDSCSGGFCSHTAITCNDSNTCTTDTCAPATGCVFTPITCPVGQTCVNGICSSTCQPKNAACTLDSQCCSNRCIGSAGAKKCK